MTKRRSELAIVAVLALVQFVATVDFTIVLPLGPDFAAALGMPSSAIGQVAAAYTVCAAIAGLIGARGLDRIDRRRALMLAMLGLSVAALASSLCTDLLTLTLARAAAGACGGPAAALVQSIVADTVPESRRGRAMALVLGANAIAAIAGVPAALVLANLGGWSLPFVATGILGLIATAVTLLLPAGRSEQARAPTPIHVLLRRSELRVGVWMILATVGSSFLLTPNLSAYVQLNLGLPREAIPGLYALGGVAGLVSMQVCGALVDRVGALPVALLTTVGFVAVVLGFIVVPQPWLSPTAAFVVLLISLAGRNVSARTLATQLPAAHERTGYLSLLSAAQHTAAALGALGSATLLRDGPGGALIGMGTVGQLAIAVSLLVPLAVGLSERRLVRRLARPAPAPAPAEARP